jgi:RNA polymerase sigma-70 factor (ECF subfamily)
MMSDRINRGENIKSGFYNEGAQERKDQFEHLFIPLMDNLYSLALRLTRNTHDAQDLVQETYLKAFRFYGHFEKNTNARAWIITILINIFRTRYRQSQREPRYIDLETVENFSLAEELELIPGPANKSEVRDNEAITEFLKSFVSDDVIKALEEIPVLFRTAVLLSDVEQFNYQEIADILGTNVGTVKSRIFRGRKLLQKKLYDFALRQGICRG